MKHDLVSLPLNLGDEPIVANFAHERALQQVVA
ncbi:hypothetical protein B0G77_6861 [Paraburkholderia sp. BL10I2N1]|nr:hypothetical protein B0G77_6861 [Paraburkholderia sp. BL10I2N1]